MVIEQTGLLFTQAEQTRQLSARVLDADGAVLSRAVNWTASDPLDIAVDATGLARAVSGSGSSQIVAEVDGVRSAPLLAVVTAVAPGTVLVDDAQVLRGPVETVPDAAPLFENTYTVILSGPPPALDSLLVGTGSVPVAGRVVNTEVVADGVLVTLTLVPVSTLFPSLEINQVIDLSDVPVEIPPAIAEDFGVVREGDRLIFTSRPEPEPAALAAKAAVPVGTRVVQNNCEVESPTFTGENPPITFAKPLVFDIAIKPSVDLLFTSSRGFERLVVNAEPTFNLAAEPKLVLALDGKISCKFELFLIPIPVGGPVALVLGGVIPVGVGAELAGKLTVADASVAVKTTVRNTIAAGLDCASGCGLVQSFGEFDVSSEVTVNAPGLEDQRFEPAFELFGYAEAAIGNRFLKSLRFTAVEAKAGAKLSGNFALKIAQILAKDYRSSYDLKLAAGIKPGKDITSALKLLGHSALGEDGLSIDTTLATSPAGSLTADRASFRPGDDLNFTVSLDPQKATFLGNFNVGEVLIVHQRSDTNVSVVGRRPGVPGQNVYDFAFTATESGTADQFFAFVITELAPLDLLALELGQAQGPAQAVMRRLQAEAVSVISSNNNGNQLVANERVVRESDPAAFLPAYRADAPLVSSAGASATGAGELSADVGEGGGFSTIQMQCSGADRGSQQVNLTAASASITFAIFEVPGTTPVSYALRPPDSFRKTATAATSETIVALYRGQEADLLLPPPGGTTLQDNGFPTAAVDPNSPDTLFLGAAFLSGTNGPLSGQLAPGRYVMLQFCNGAAFSELDEGDPAGSIDYDNGFGLDLGAPAPP